MPAGVYLAFANANIDVHGLVTNAAATSYVQSTYRHIGSQRLFGRRLLDPLWPERLVSRCGAAGDVLQRQRNDAIREPADQRLLVSSPRSKAGYPIPLPLGPLFVLEPQAQIIWQQVSFNQANDGLGPVALGTTSGSTGRVGVRGMWTIIGENGQVWQPYARANLWRDWGAEATTTFGIDPVPLIEAGDAARVRRRRDRQARRRCQPLCPGRLSVCSR